MEIGDIKYDNILNPEEAFREFKKYLMQLYVEDYGIQFSNLIKDRIDGTYYLFDSNPVDTYNFYKSNSDKGFGFKKIFRIEREYHNYISVKKRIDTELTKKYKDIIASFYNTTSNFLDDDFLVVDFEAFSFENVRKLHSINTSDENRNSIIRRQNNYINFCNLYGVKPITDMSIIDKMVKIKKNLEFEEFKLLLDDTIWGKRIIKDIYEKTGVKVNTKLLGSVMFDNKCCASVCQIPSEDNKKNARICFFPVMKNYYLGCLDKVFYHENRHVVESGLHASGIACVNGYNMINEIRTQENAIRDSYEFRRVPLFCNIVRPGTNINLYERLFDYCGPFVKNYLGLLNNIGITNDFFRLEYLFGRDNLMELENHLIEADSSLLKGFCDKIDINKQRVLNYRLDGHFASRHM